MKVILDSGETLDLGETEATPTIGIVDYSRRVTDDYGVTTVVERDFARRMSVRLVVPFDQTDALQRDLAAIRAKPARWIADEGVDWLDFRGFFKDFEIDLPVPPKAYCTLTVEALAATEAFADPGGDPAPLGHASTLHLLQPATVEGGALVATTVPENDYPEWAAGTTYPLGARVIKAATHRIYESGSIGNVGNDPAGVSGKWSDVGPTSRWAMFDQALGSTTTAPGQISVTLSAGTVNAVALLDVKAAAVRVVAAGYDRTLAPNASGTVTFLDLPETAGQVTVTITGPGAVEVGTLMVGKLVGLGSTTEDAKAGITDFSRKEADEFGDIQVVERAWAKRATIPAKIRRDAIDLVAGRIAAVRAKPSLWIGKEGMETLTVYGFFKDFSIQVDTTICTLSLSLEGLSTAGKVEPLTASVDWPDVGDPLGTKPEDNATVGAPAGTDVAGKPAEEVVGQLEDQDAALSQLDQDVAAAAAAAVAAQALAQQIQSSVTADIGELTAEIGTVSANLADLTSEVGTVSASLSDLSSEVGTVSASLADLTTQVGTVTVNIGDLADAVTAAGGRIDTIQTTLGQQGASITSLQTTVSNHTGTLAQHTSQISAANASISTNATAISTANQNIASLSTRVGTAESSISQQATAITGLTGRTASLETSLTSQGASITSLQTTTSTLSGNLAEYQLRLSSNSPNLLANSTGEAGLRGYSGAGAVWSVISSISNAPYFLCMPSGAGTFVLASDPIAVEAGAPLTIGYETQNSGASGVSCYVDVFCYDASGNTLLDGPQNAAMGATNWGDRANRAVSFTTPANTATMRVRLVATATATTDRIRIRRIKLERGTTWSAWSSEASIAQSFSAITTAETSLASLTTTVSTQGAAVSSQATAITNLTGRTASLETSVSSQGASITSLQSATSTQGGDIATLKTQMSTANANISTNATAITTTNQNLASLTTRVSSAESSITSQATAITGLTGRTASLETLVSSQGASITSLQTTTSTLSGNVATLTTQVSAGNPNLLPNGSGENGKTGWTGANFTVASDANGTYFTATANGTYTLQSDSFQVWANTNYTISAGFGFLATGGTVYVDMLFLNASGTSVLDGPENPQAPGRAAFGTTGADRRVIAVTATAPATAVRAVARFVVNGATGMTYAAVRQIKVEAGSLATTYSAEASITQSLTSLTTLNSQYASLSTTVGTQGTTISSQATAITNLTGRTASLETSVSSQSASITSLQSATSTQGGDIATLKTQMSTANANISTNATAITTTNQNLASLTTRVSSAESSITSQATAITGLTGRTASLETTVSSQGASISSLQTTTSTIAGNVAALTTQVSAGNPNLLPNGGFENGGAGWSGANFSFYAAGANGAYAVCNSNGTNSISSDKFAVWPSTTYTISGSFGFVGSGAGVVYLDMIFYNASGAVVLDSAQSPVGQNVKPAFVSDGSDRKLIAMAVTSPANAVSAVARFVVEGATGMSYAAVRQIKVEQGAIATPYSAEASAIQSFTALSTLTTQYASLSTTVSTQGVTVSQQQTAISSLNGTVGMLYGRAAMMVTIGSDGVSRAYGIEVNGTQLGGGIDIHGDYFRVTKPGGGKRMEYTGDALRLYADNGVAVIEMTV